MTSAAVISVIVQLKLDEPKKLFVLFLAPSPYSGETTASSLESQGQRNMMQSRQGNCILAHPCSAFFRGENGLGHPRLPTPTILSFYDLRESAGIYCNSVKSQF